jgi:hypothetical protein
MVNCRALFTLVSVCSEGLINARVEMGLSCDHMVLAKMKCDSVVSFLSQPTIELTSDLQ